MKEKAEVLYIVLAVVFVLGFLGGAGYLFVQIYKQGDNPNASTPTTTTTATTTINPQNTQKMFTELIKEDTVVGTGKEAKSGNTIVVNYTGKLLDGTVFDSSLKAGREPFEFVLGSGQVIQGWDKGFDGMKEGGKRTLKIPSNMAYGDQGAGSLIPPGADLVFEVELLQVK